MDIFVGPGLNLDTKPWSHTVQSKWVLGCLICPLSVWFMWDFRLMLLCLEGEDWGKHSRCYNLYRISQNVVVCRSVNEVSRVGAVWELWVWHTETHRMTCSCSYTESRSLLHICAKEWTCLSVIWSLTDGKLSENNESHFSWPFWLVFINSTRLNTAAHSFAGGN